jgi:hypothetical protein
LCAELVDTGAEIVDGGLAWRAAPFTDASVVERGATVGTEPAVVHNGGRFGRAFCRTVQ